MNVAVFCASSRRIDDGFRDVAERLGRLLAEHGCTLVYGGGDIGLMGVLARSVHEHGGRVIGIIPHALRGVEGVAYETADELVMTDTMSARKMLMYERADLFVALPGGLGTLEEFLEIVTLRKLGYHDRPVFLINPDGFYDTLLSFFSELESGRFMDAAQPALFETFEQPDEIFASVAFRELQRAGL